MFCGKKTKKIGGIFLIMFLFFMCQKNVFASSGRLRKDSITTCNGVTYGQHSSDNHWHVASKGEEGYYATGSPIYSNPCSSVNESYSNNSSSTNQSYSNNSSSTNQNYSNNQDLSKVDSSIEEPVKSKDTNIKKVIIDETEFQKIDSVEYSTVKSSVTVKVETNDEKANYEVENNDNLSIGENHVLVIVTAEDGTEKTYDIKVIREKMLSSNTNITLTIDEEAIQFKSDKAEISVSSLTNKISIDCKLQDPNANVEMSEINPLKTGENLLKIMVTAEDGTKREYQVEVYKNSVWIDLISIGVLIGTVYVMYVFFKKLIKKIKRNKYVR